jgi:hypothetical protein
LHFYPFIGQIAYIGQDRIIKERRYRNIICKQEVLGYIVVNVYITRKAGIEQCEADADILTMPFLPFQIRVRVLVWRI